MRIALVMTLGDFVIDSEVEERTLDAVAALRSRGAVVDEVTLPWTRAELTRVAWIHFGAIFGSSISQLSEEHSDALMPYTREFTRRAQEAAAGTPFIDGLAAEGAIYEPVGELFENYEALVTPTFAGTGLVAGDDYTDTKLSIGGEQFDYFDAFLTMPFNILSRCPALSVPSGRASNRVPTGLQIVGPTYDDVSVFRVGAAVEAELGLATDPEWRPELPVA
jgi:aspartyl-tRNA(Asn)/glutamyl-tRNA(Gln) amidotransferase subunit A